jgi:flagellin-like hook-associated protein FlgL
MSAAYNLSNTSVNLQRSLNRLSSGSRINSSFDDAGGLAVSMRLSAAIRRTEATQANVSNAQAFLETQDGVLKSADKVVARMSELTQLATDITKNATDISLYNTEFATLKAQLQRLSEEKFNGISLFSTDSSTIAQLSVVSSQDGAQSIGITQADLAENPFMNMMINGFKKFVLGGETFIARQDIDDADMQVNTSNGVSVYSLATGQEYVLNTAGTHTAATGTVPPAPGNPPGTYVTLHNINYALYTTTGSAVPGKSGTFTANYSLTGQSTATAPSVNVTLDDLLGNGTFESSLEQTSLNEENALDYANLAQLAIQATASFRASNGSEQVRLAFAADMLSANKTNLEAANGRIMDVDIAAESANLARLNILQQAGTAMLAQANQSNQSLLRLLV